jgi:hypothetical protein
VQKAVPTLTSTSVEIYLSMTGAKQLGDTRFILVPAGAVRPAGVCSRHCIALYVVLAEGSYKQGGRGGEASRSLSLIEARYQYCGEDGERVNVCCLSSPAARRPPSPFIGQGEAVYNRATLF